VHDVPPARRHMLLQVSCQKWVRIGWLRGYALAPKARPGKQARPPQAEPALQDMAELERRHGQADVRLRLRFKRGLYPFYPPAVELLQPRFCGPLLGALASHPMLQVPRRLPMLLHAIPCCATSTVTQVNSDVICSRTVL
jgi:hypothetical protein